MGEWLWPPGPECHRRGVWGGLLRKGGRGWHLLETSRRKAGSGGAGTPTVVLMAVEKDLGGTG